MLPALKGREVQVSEEQAWVAQSKARLKTLREYLSEEFGYDPDEDREAFNAALEEIDMLIGLAASE